MNKDSLNWKTGLAYKLSLGVTALTIIIALMDLFYAPIFVNETASSKVQVLGQDIVNLLLAAPALLLSLHYSKQGSMKARTISIGVLAYLAYTFLSYCVIFKLNPGFLLYTAAFGLSFYATILSLAGIKIDDLDITLSPGAKKWAPYSMILLLIMITLLWTPDIMNYYLKGQLPASMTVDNVHTLIIPFQDYSLIVPLALITAWLLWKEEKTGYILAPIILVKALSIALAVFGMIAFMKLSGTPVVLGQTIIFVIGAAIIGVYTSYYYKGMEIRQRKT